MSRKPKRTIALTIIYSLIALLSISLFLIITGCIYVRTLEGVDYLRGDFVLRKRIVIEIPNIFLSRNAFPIPLFYYTRQINEKRERLPAFEYTKKLSSVANQEMFFDPMSESSSDIWGRHQGECIDYIGAIGYVMMEKSNTENRVMIERAIVKFISDHESCLRPDVKFANDRNRLIIQLREFCAIRSKNDTK